MDDLVKEILTKVDDQGDLGDLARELEAIINDHRAGDICDVDAKELIEEACKAYGSHSDARDEVIIRWVAKIVELASKAM